MDVSESLLAYILYRKYALYVPLYRQEQDFLQLGAPIGRTSMAKWAIIAGREYMQPLYDYLHRELLKRRFLMMDETPVQVLKEDGRRAQTKSYFWVVRTGEDVGAFAGRVGIHEDLNAAEKGRDALDFVDNERRGVCGHEGGAVGFGGEAVVGVFEIDVGVAREKGFGESGFAGLARAEDGYDGILGGETPDAGSYGAFYHGKLPMFNFGFLRTWRL